MTTEPHAVLGHQLFHPTVVRAIERLSDPGLTVVRPLVKGRAPGRKDMQDATFPPKGIHLTQVPAVYRMEMESWVTFELELMVFWYCTEGDANYTVVGLLSHDQAQRLGERMHFDVPVDLRFVAVSYRPFMREGKVFIGKELYDALQIAQSEDLYRARVHARENLPLRDLPTQDGGPRGYTE